MTPQTPTARCFRCRAVRPLVDVVEEPHNRPNGSVVWARRGTCVTCGGEAFQFIPRPAAPFEMGVSW